MVKWFARPTADTSAHTEAVTDAIVPSATVPSAAAWQAEAEEGLREFRLVGTARNPRFPACLSLISATSQTLVVRVEIRNPDLPQASPLDGLYGFSVNQHGRLDVQEPGTTVPGWGNIVNFDVWEVLNGISQQEFPSFMWCVRRVASAGEPGVLALFVRWLPGRYLWRS